jgi:alanyl-tRNA synthetase
VRRIEAQTGEGAYELLKQREDEFRTLADVLKTNPTDVLAKARKLVTTLKEKDDEIDKLKARLSTGQSGAGAAGTPYTVVEVAGAPNVYWQQIDGMEMKDLRSLADTLREKHKAGIFALGSVKDDKVSLLVASTTAVFPANELIKPAAVEIGGSGGGRPEMAQAGGKRVEGLKAAIERVIDGVKRIAGV